jgi:hypothetical protein
VDTILATLVELLVAPIPFLASSGLMLLGFATLWLAFGIALVRDPSRVDRAWVRLRARPLVVQALAWLLFLPVLAGAWIWRTGWPRVARLGLITSLAGWNLLVLVPRPA